MTTTKLRITASRSRRHEVEWTTIGSPIASRTIRLTTSTGCSVAPISSIQGALAARPRELDPAVVQPDDEDLGLDRAFDVDRDGQVAHGAMVRGCRLTLERRTRAAESTVAMHAARCLGPAVMLR